jgi:hypothetical protein
MYTNKDEIYTSEASNVWGYGQEPTLEKSVFSGSLK